MKSQWLAMIMVIVIITSCKKDKKENTLSADQAELNISGLINGSASLQITSNTHWTIKAAGNADWLEIEPSSGTGDATVQLKNKTQEISTKTDITLTLSGEGSSPVTIKVTRTPLFHDPVLNVLGGSTIEEFSNGAATPDGGYILVGYTNSNTVDFSTRLNNDYDGVAAKYTAAGILEWKQFYGGASRDIFSSVLATQDGGYLLTGSTLSTDGDFASNRGRSDFWILKVDKNGVKQWSKLYGSKGQDDGLTCVAINDGYLIAGNIAGNEGDVTEHFGFADAWIIKLDLNGNLKWQKSYGGSENDHSAALVLTSDGNCVLAGSYSSSDGIGAEGAQGLLDAWLMKFDVNNGNMIWSKRYGGSQPDLFTHICTTKSGEFIAVGASRSNDGQLTGLHSGDEDALVAKIAADGQLKQISLYGGVLNDRLQAAVSEGEQGFIVAGYTVNNNFGTNKGSVDAMILWIDHDMKLIHSKLIGTTGSDAARLLLKTTRNRYVTGGHFSGGNGDFSAHQGSLDCWSILFQ